MSLFQTKLDLFKSDKPYYGATTAPQLVQLTPIPYLSITGQGAPDREPFVQAVESLYTVAYAIKNSCKKESQDFVVPKLEGLWWANGERHMLDIPRDQWQWKLLIRMPDYVDARNTEDASKLAAAKKKTLEPIRRVTFEILNEGTCVQMLHVGPYSTEPETIEQMHSYIEARRLVQAGLHHEIYLSDPRKVKPDQMKTIIRYPVTPLNES
ncbi:GyrI-like domain-containing protein [Paenibacillus daejeonensis]|uniref:GyrI-like domain-containing protein n=1 Tax=Paenibacillus daejeonensis TaxID=135193 RepID=UPI00037273EF|nr:GyrI-like domain-containing protein [Paenibacillus daejeonensis]